MVVRYRNRLTHHINPSVDYPVFYSQLHSRDFISQYDENGNITATSKIIYAALPVDYAFTDLYAAYLEYLSAAVQMLDRLSAVPSLHL